MKFNNRRTFAIISHPDAGKTTITEQLLLLGGSINTAGTVKGRKGGQHAKSDWMAMEKERGISVTSSVMQFPYADRIINLLDTPGHGDFSEDTYRTLTAVDSALMIIDAAKGVEARTIQLMQVCRLRDTPIMTFINKLDRDGREPIELMDEIERIMQLECTPLTWPIGMGQEFDGLYHFLSDTVELHHKDGSPRASLKLDDPEFDKLLGSARADELREEIELIQEATSRPDIDAYLQGKQTPVFFGSAFNNIGVAALLDYFASHAPEPLERQTQSRTVHANESKMTGFIFKIQANMDPKHRDRIAFMRLCSGTFTQGMKLHHARLKRDVKISNAITFMAGDRNHAETAIAGDIIGLHNHGTIHIGDTFTQGEDLKFTGIPNFAPELFRRVVLQDPLRSKALQKGLEQLCEEGASQLLRPLERNDLIVGAIGVLQFEVVAFRLKHEYNVECRFDHVDVFTAHWVSCNDEKKLAEFKRKEANHLALDGTQSLTYLAPTRAHIRLIQDRWPEIQFHTTREH